MKMGTKDGWIKVQKMRPKTPGGVKKVPDMEPKTPGGVNKVPEKGPKTPGERRKKRSQESARHCPSPALNQATVAASWEEENIEKFITLEANLRGAIIGPQGKTIQMLQQTFGVIIEIPRKENLSNYVVVIGSAQKVEEAVTKIQEIIEEQKAANTKRQQAVKTVTKALVVEETQRGAVIGPQGNTVHSLAEKYNVKICIPPRGTAGSITVRGQEQDVDNTICEVNKIVFEKQNKQRRISTKISKVPP